MSLLACCLAAALGAGAVAGDESRELARGALGEELVAFAKATELAGFRGAMLAAKDGEVVAACGVGSADAKGRVPNTPATLFELASATKQLTAAAVARLAQDGALSLDDPLADHLPGVPEDCGGITLRHLLQHTSGIPRTNSKGAGRDLAVLLPLFLDGGPRHEPGTHFEYWNQGYALLAEVIERVSERDYVEYCAGVLFEPAGMSSTCFTGQRAPRGAAVSVGRSAYGEARGALEHPYGSYGLQYMGMGGAVSNVWDLWRWDRALCGDDVLGEASREELFRPGLGDYALGWYVRTNAAGHRVQSHGGAVRGFGCELRRYPERDAFLVVLGNQDSFPVWNVAQGLEERLLGDEPKVLDPPGPVEKKLAQAVEGRFEDDAGNAALVEVVGARVELSIQWKDARWPPTRLHLGEDAEGGLVAYEWFRCLPVTVERRGGRPASTIRIHDRGYARVD